MERALIILKPDAVQRDMYDRVTSTILPLRVFRVVILELVRLWKHAAGATIIGHC